VQLNLAHNILAEIWWVRETFFTPAGEVQNTCPETIFSHVVHEASQTTMPGEAFTKGRAAKATRDRGRDREAKTGGDIRFQSASNGKDFRRKGAQVQPEGPTFFFCKNFTRSEESGSGTTRTFGPRPIVKRDVRADPR